MLMDTGNATLTDTGMVMDTFVSGLGEVEDLGGGCYRFVFFAKQHIDGREELVVVAKLVAPLDAVPPALFMAARAIGLSLMPVPKFISGTVH